MATKRAGLSDIQQGRRRSTLRLLAPVRYLVIDHPEKSFYDFKLPLVIGTLAWLGYTLIEPKPTLFGEAGLLRFTRDFLIMAVPFMVGALASVAMGGPGAHMDRRPPGQELYLDGNVLTLRQFVCYLLGYLSFLGLFTLVSVVFAEIMKPFFVSVLSGSPKALALVTHLSTFVFAMQLSSLAITVLWSLYFLTDVVNRRAGEP